MGERLRSDRRRRPSRQQVAAAGAAEIGPDELRAGAAGLAAKVKAAGPAPRPGRRVRRAARGGGLAAYFRSTRFPAGRSCLSASNRASALGRSQSTTDPAPDTLALRAIGTVPATPSPLLTERIANGKRIRW